MKKNHWILPGIMLSNDKEISSFIVKMVCAEFDVSEEDLLGVVRKRRFVDARRICGYLIHKRTRSMSLREMADILKARDHSSILYYINTTQDLMGSEPQINNTVKRLLSDLDGLISYS